MDTQWINEFWSQIQKKLAVTSEQIGANFPYTTVDGVYSKFVHREGLSWWTNGFWGGMMWLMYEDTKEVRYLDIARGCEEKLDVTLDQFTGLHHDVGFMWLTTAVADYKLTGDQKAKVRGLHAATLLAGRFNIKGNFINAWNGEARLGWSIIDSMMNLPLLYWASEVSGDPRFAHIAKAHADTVQKVFIRDDGSSNHIVIFDPVTGKVKQKPRGQGYAEGSAWSRGQSWALYGFTASYIYTGDESYLQTAKKCANYFLSQLDETGVPDIDFRAPKEPVLKDTTAGAVAASAFVQLAELSEGEERTTYLSGAEKLLRGLEANCDFSLNEQSILQNGSEAYHKENGHHMPIIYGDYYLMEALLKLKKRELIRIF